MLAFAEHKKQDAEQARIIAAAQRTDIHVLSNGERWRYCTGHEFAYMVSNWGRVYVCSKTVGLGQKRKPKHISILHGSCGYLTVSLSGFTKKTVTVHSLVADAFIGPHPVGNHINHKDGNKHNNSLSNLEYCTPRENAQHYQRMKRTKAKDGSA